jgi:hypothetical protein
MDFAAAVRYAASAGRRKGRKMDKSLVLIA